MTEAVRAANPKRKNCFVIGPIGEEGTEVRQHADWVLDFIVKPVFQRDEFDFDVRRADEITVPGQISSQVITAIYEADLVVADLTFQNPNAFYELAIRHVIGKPIIHICRSDHKIPFDVGDFRTIKFDLLPKKIPSACDELIKQARATQAANYVVDNPVLTALGKQKLEASAAPVDRLIAGIIERIDQHDREIADLKDIPSISNSMFAAPYALNASGGNAFGTGGYGTGGNSGAGSFVTGGSSGGAATSFGGGTSARGFSADENLAEAARIEELYLKIKAEQESRNARRKKKKPSP